MEPVWWTPKDGTELNLGQRRRPGRSAPAFVSSDCLPCYGLTVIVPPFRLIAQAPWPGTSTLACT